MTEKDYSYLKDMKKRDMAWRRARPLRTRIRWAWEPYHLKFWHFLKMLHRLTCIHDFHEHFLHWEAWEQCETCEKKRNKRKGERFWHGHGVIKKPY